jgi:hypothetical protein
MATLEGGGGGIPYIVSGLCDANTTATLTSCWTPLERILALCWGFLLFLKKSQGLGFSRAFWL